MWMLLRLSAGYRAVLTSLVHMKGPNHELLYANGLHRIYLSGSQCRNARSQRSHQKQ
jgi:hypothetical protein